jgi:cell wall-associated NlpC family hydrolase
MKRNILLLVLSVLIIISCGSRNSVANKPKNNYPAENLRNLNSKYIGKNSLTVNKILEAAEDFLGTPYKLGGKTKSGLDCSGLVITVFDENDVKLPRRSAEQAKQGKKIDVSEAKPGDLLFFSTAKSGEISHVGIVKEIKNKGEITFIHASTTKGVIISSLNEKYWNKAFLFARRVL